MSGAVVAVEMAAQKPPAAGGGSRTSVATYAFPEANNTHPTSFSDLCGGSGQIQVATGNAYRARYSGLPSDSRWGGAGSFTNDQYASAVVSGFTTGQQDDSRIGVIARASSDVDAGRDMYRCYVSNTETTRVMTLERCVNGTITVLGTNSAQSWVAGDRVEIECQGTTIRGMRNGAVVIEVTDTSLTTGLPGIYAYQGSIDVLRGDDWEAGNLT
jgi:hypothetical protein